MNSNEEKENFQRLFGEELAEIRIDKDNMRVTPLNPENEMKLSDQALGALMMALQKSLMEQSDIVPALKDFKFRLSESGLMVMNPPLVKFGHDDEEEE